MIRCAIFNSAFSLRLSIHLHWKHWWASSATSMILTTHVAVFIPDKYMVEVRREDGLLRCLWPVLNHLLIQTPGQLPSWLPQHTCVIFIPGE
ncbi:BLOC-2 complex member HPS5 [Trichinella pseudospiralis]